MHEVSFKTQGVWQEIHSSPNPANQPASAFHNRDCVLQPLREPDMKFFNWRSWRGGAHFTRNWHVMNVSWSPLKFVLEEADEARLHGDNYKAEALINIAFDILDRQHNARRDRTAPGTVEE
jgi:hypothetical protein